MYDRNTREKGYGLNLWQNSIPEASIHLRPSDEDSPKSFEDSLEYISDVLGATGVGDGDGFFSSASSSFTASSRFVSRSITEQTKIHYHSTSK